MALDLVSLINQFLTPQIVSALARATGINEAIAQKLVAAAIPMVLGSIGTTVAAPGGAQKLVDAVSNSDPDLLTKLAGAVGGGNLGALGEGANMLSGLLGGSGLSSLVGALGQYAGAPHAATQSAIGTVAQAAIGTLGQQDPSNWSDPSAIAALFGSQKGAIAAALPPEISKALGATGLLAGLGGIGAAAAQSAGATASRAADAAQAAAQSAASAATSAASAAQQAARSAEQAAARSSGFPIWAIVLLVVIVLAAIWWFMSQGNAPAPAPAKTGLSVPIEFALEALPGSKA